MQFEYLSDLKILKNIAISDDLSLFLMILNFV